MSELKNKIIEMGGNEWERGEMSRVYITNDILNKLRDEKGLSPVSYGERNNKLFFDVSANAIMRSYKGKKPEVEVQY